VGLKGKTKQKEEKKEKLNVQNFLQARSKTRHSLKLQHNPMEKGSKNYCQIS